MLYTSASAARWAVRMNPWASCTRCSASTGDPVPARVSRADQPLPRRSACPPAVPGGGNATESCGASRALVEARVASACALRLNGVQGAVGGVYDRAHKMVSTGRVKPCVSNSLQIVYVPFRSTRADRPNWGDSTMRSIRQRVVRADAWRRFRRSTPYGTGRTGGSRARQSDEGWRRRCGVACVLSLSAMIRRSGRLDMASATAVAQGRFV